MQTHDLPGGARLHVPEGARFDTGLELTLHLHGAHEVVRDAFVRARRPGALATLTLPGLSAVYTRHFAADPAGTFGELVDAARRAVGAASVERVWVSSFSAGFGGVRELLKAQVSFERIDALILADTLYAGFARPAVGDERPEPDPRNLEGFVRYAREAAAGRRALLMTYCDLLPPGYAATRETAAALRAAVGVRGEACAVGWPDQLTLTHRARIGRFATYGFAGDDGAAHMRHLRGLWMWYRLVPRA